MRYQRLHDRLDVLEQARWERLTPLERATELLARNISVREWGDAELDAYCATFPPIEGMDALSDAELDQIIDAPESPAGRAILDRLGVTLKETDERKEP